MKRIEGHMRKKFLQKVAAVIILVAVVTTAGFFCFKGVYHDAYAAVGSVPIKLDAEGQKFDVADRLDNIPKKTGENAWAFDYLALLDELEQDEYYSGDGIEYKLVYLDGDIPALAAGHTGYAVSVFVWHDGEITTLMDREGYGTWGRYWGYQPYQNRIHTFCYYFDDETYSAYWDIYQISESYEMEFLYVLSYTQEKEKNLVSYYYWEDIQLIEEPVEITEEEFSSYFLEDVGNKENAVGYKTLVGDSDIEDMRWQLGHIINPDKEEAVFLRKVMQGYNDEKQVEELHFLFSNDTLVDMERKRNPYMRDVLYRDITGDGIDEVLVYQEEWYSREPEGHLQKYMSIDFFQVEEDVVTEISPWTQLEELRDELWNMEILEYVSKEYGGIVLRMENYENKAEKSVDESFLVGYRDGVWKILQREDW